MNLLLLPGLITDARLWRAQIDSLAKMANATVADLTRSDSMAELAADALSQLPAGPFAMAGLSMGGYVALEIMRQAPERVLALSLLDTSARPDTPEATENRRKAIAQSATDYDGVIDGLIEKLLHPEHRGNVGLASVVRDMGRDAGRAAFVRQQEAIIGRIDSRPHLAQIRVPTLIACGREDTVTPVEVHQEMHAQIPSSRLIVVEHCGHLSPLEQPGRISAAMADWLRELA